MAERVVVHVASPRRDFLVLQDILWENRILLAEQAVALLGSAFHDRAFAARTLLGSTDLEPQRARDAWPRIVRQAERAPGTAVLSHDLLAAATSAQVQEVLAAFDDAEVHVVATSRAGTAAPAGPAYVGDVLRTWQAELPAERVHLVTVPATGTDELLWGRFAAVLRLRPDPRLHLRLDRRAAGGPAEVEPDAVSSALEELVAPAAVWDHLGHRLDGNRPRRDDRDTAQALAELATCGYDVVGDLDELLPGPRDDQAADPEEAELLDAMLDGLAVALRRRRDLHHEVLELRERLRPHDTAADDGPRRTDGGLARLRRSALGRWVAKAASRA